MYIILETPVAVGQKVNNLSQPVCTFTHPSITTYHYMTQHNGQVPNDHDYENPLFEAIVCGCINPVFGD